jgi:hypothetical protein
MAERFNPRACWLALDADQQRTIGEAALLLAVSTEAQAINCENGTPSPEVLRVDRRWEHAEQVGSPEQQNPNEWRALIAELRAGGEFRCHKGAPILGVLEDKPTFDTAWVQRRGRKCAGFMLLVWAMHEKGEDWFARHIEFCGAPGYDLPIDPAGDA